MMKVFTILRNKGISFAILLIAVGVACSKTHADDTSSVPSVRIRIHSIMASGHLEGENAAPRAIPANLSSLESKLNKLPFSEYRSIESNMLELPMMRKASVGLPEGEKLTLRPLGIEAETESLLLWVRWTDATGMKVLDGRVHVPLGETMVTGADRSTDSGLVLAIKGEAIK